MLTSLESISDLQSLETRQMSPNPHQIWPRTSAQLQNGMTPTQQEDLNVDLLYREGTLALLNAGLRRRGEGRGQPAQAEEGSKKKGGGESGEKGGGCCLPFSQQGPLRWTRPREEELEWCVS
jgi:hypothetical protein